MEKHRDDKEYKPLRKCIRTLEVAGGALKQIKDEIFCFRNSATIKSLFILILGGDRKWMIKINYSIRRQDRNRKKNFKLKKFYCFFSECCSFKAFWTSATFAFGP